jgi:tetratricopeptide (TPR) repeat protein
MTGGAYADAPLRRLAVTAAGLAIAAFLLRPQLAAALVMRGDECLSRSAPADALRYYHRALAIDGDDGLALDRWLFTLTMLRRRSSLRVAAQAAVPYLHRHPDDSVVRWDLAVALRALGFDREAMTQFAEVAVRQRDARAWVFAALAARNAREFRAARRMLSTALALNPDFAVARRTLRRLDGAR